MDAAYSYWGSTRGPVATNGDPLTCGAVSTRPWFVESSRTTTAANGSMFASRNRDGSPTPDEQLAASEAAANQRLADAQIRCDDGYQDACDVISAYQRCFGAALSAARGESHIPYSDEAHTAGDLVGAAGDLVSSAEAPILQTRGAALGAIGLVISTASSILSLNDAYNTCFG